MKFLKAVYEKTMQYDTRTTTIMLPSQRAAVYLREIFKQSEKTIMLPRILTMEQFVQEHSGIVPEDELSIALYAYRLYRDKGGDRDFPEFVKVFSIMQRDFNDIDMYMADIKQLSSLNEIAQIEDYDEHTYAHRYFSIMQIFADIYLGINRIMDEKKTGYRGYMYRQALRNMSDADLPDNIVIAGFNILTPIEQHIIDKLIAASNVHILFNAPEMLLKKQHESTETIRKHLKKWPRHAENIDCTNNESISIYSYSLPTDQTKIISESFDAGNGAVVLSDESLMMPAVNAIPEHIDRINITMGYPMKMTPVFMFYRSVINMHVNRTDRGFYRNDLLNLMENRYINRILGGHAFAIKSRIRKTAQSYLKIRPLIKDYENEITESLFDWYDDKGQLLEPVEILNKLIAVFESTGGHEGDSVIAESNIITMINVFNRLITLFASENQLIDRGNAGKMDSLISSVAGRSLVPFSGDPLQQFQVMGMLETRCLEFEKTVLLSVNEGFMPKGKDSSSFIPFEVRVAWGLPTYKHNDALFSYYFYSLILNSRQSIVTYAMEGDESYTQKSRFIEQLRWEQRENGIFENHNIQWHSDETDVENIIGIEIITKTRDMVRLIKKKGFSPSSISSYIWDPLAFFKQYVMQVSEENAFDEIGANIIGNAAHRAMEEIYKPLLGGIYQYSRIDCSIESVTRYIVDSFRKDNISDTNSGKPYLMKTVIAQLVQNFIEADNKRSENNIIIQQLEGKYYSTIDVNGDNIPIGGRFDRIEMSKDRKTIYIMDYKTGAVDIRDVKIRDMNTLIDIDGWKDNEHYEKIFQLLFYGYVGCRQKGWEDYDIQLGIYSLRSPSEVYYLTDNRGNSIIYRKDSEVDKRFALILRDLITEILDINKPFEHVERKEWW